MKALRIIGLTAFLAVFLTGPALAAQAPVGLGAATGFAVLAHETITNTGPTTITGDVGLSPGTSVTGFNTVTLHGTLHKTDAAAQQAQSALTTAYNDAAGRTPSSSIPSQLGGQVLKAGVYKSPDGTFLLTGTLTLNGEGNPNAVFIFQAASTLTTASGSSVVLSGQAQACDVFWQIGSSATLGTRSALKGSILAQDSITLTTNAKLDGRAMARTGAVTLDTNVIALSGCAAVAPTPTPTPTPAASASSAASASAPATTAPVVTVPPTSTSGSGDSGSGPSSSTMILFAGLAAGAAFVTIRRFSAIHR
jgi:hypothetical protein